MKTWFAFRVRPQREFRVIEELTRRGFEAIAPAETRFHARRGRQNKRIERKYPLLISYVLVAFETDRPWYWIGNLLNLDDISSVISIDGQPAAITDERIQRFVRHAGLVSSPGRTRKSFQVGELVKITEGPFANHEAKIEDIRGVHCKLITSLFGRPTPVKMKLHQIEAA
ncbi:transcription termination/antitermination NusG family protein [uncultured Paracoccus sp.]|uniref:transcription termination/antitermination protein NusG n=1 Tax=uncultured Paracoccus sp. TaxID=189685 RepID=UPI002622023A|nr:transcription termination/antitermination NusG family protein [uncultured Paracoccus sp.]